MTDPFTLVLVGCGKAKHEGRMAAKNKYSSNYFTLKREYAETTGDSWIIVSAEYGLLHPIERIDDYDTTVSGMTDEERQKWAEGVSTSFTRVLGMICDKLDYVQIHLLLGKDYREPVVDAITSIQLHADVEIIDPFEGTSGIDEQMSVLKEATR